MKLASVVEGHGEVEALPVLLRRLLPHLNPDRYVDVVKPIRVPKSKLLKEGELERAVRLASLNAGEDGAVLVLLDADADCPAELVATLLPRVTGAHQAQRASVVVAKSEFEAWFLGAAMSLRGARGLSAALAPPPDPEAVRDAKGWLTREMEGGRRYSETIDQPALAGTMALHGFVGCPSYDKLTRDLNRIIA